MKTTFTLLLLAASMMLAGAQTITWATNRPSVTLTVTATDILKANGRPLELSFPFSDFSLSNGTLRLAPRHANIATNAGDFLVPVTAPFFRLTSANTIATNSGSTFGYGAGLLAYDTNYLYISLGTNRWGRTALTTNW